MANLFSPAYFRGMTATKTADGGTRTVRSFKYGERARNKHGNVKNVYPFVSATAFGPGGLVGLFGFNRPTAYLNPRKRIFVRVSESNVWIGYYSVSVHSRRWLLMSRSSAFCVYVIVVIGLCVRNTARR